MKKLDSSQLNKQFQDIEMELEIPSEDIHNQGAQFHSNVLSNIQPVLTISDIRVDQGLTGAQPG